MPRLVLNVLAYFLLGLALLGQAHWITLREQWKTHQTQVAGGLAARWVQFSLALLALAALIAFLLPTSYTVGLLDAIMQVIGILVYAVTILFLLVSFAVGAFFRLLQSLFGLNAPAGPAQRLRLPPLRFQSPIQEQPSGLPSWLEALRTIVFWAIAVGMIAYVVRSYLRDHPGVLRALARLPLAAHAGTPILGTVASHRRNRGHGPRASGPHLGAWASGV